jgi:hypothetical protein
MSSMLWAAAAAVSAPPPVTAEQLLERARAFYAIDENRTSEKCPESREGEIVVCRAISDPDQYRVPSPTEEGRTDNGIPRAPNVSGLPDCSQATCIRMGKQPRQVNLIDLDAIPEAPEGSDADRIAKGEMAAP